MPEAARPTRIEGLAGVILAGGKSSRFGSNKALALHDGRAMVQWIADRLSPLFDELLLVTNHPESYAFLDWPMCPDRYPDCGPLAGIHAALSTIGKPGAFVCACDMPLLDPKLIRFLCGLVDDRQAVIPWLPEGPEPLHAVYNKSALPVIEASLRAGRRKISALYESLRIRKVGPEEILRIVPDYTTFQNINHQHELAGLAGCRL